MRLRVLLLAPTAILVALAACSSSSSSSDDGNNGGGEGADGGSNGGNNGLDAGGTNNLGADTGTSNDGDSSNGSDAGSGTDSGTEVDALAPFPVPLVPYNGGSIILTPTLVTVTFLNETIQSQIEAFDDVITTTPWWDATRAGYCDGKGNCVNQGKAGAHVRLTTNAKGTYTDTTTSTGASSIQSMISDLITAGTLPAPTANTLYMFYFPPGTDISLDDTKSCDAFGGYHNSMVYQGTKLAYSILPRCVPAPPNNSAADTFNYLTTAASHEIAEAVTDPIIPPDASNYDGYGGLDDAFDQVAGGEVGDRCFDIYGEGTDLYTQGIYTVQRIFNNPASAYGHDPCVPAPSPAVTPYYNVAPLKGDSLTLAVGKTTTFQVQAVSDGEPGPLQFAVTEETNALQKGSNVLTVSADKSTLNVGDMSTVTVKLNAAPDQGYAIFFMKVAAGNNTHHYWPVTVQTP